MVGQICPERANYAFSEKFWIRPKTGFLTHNFGYRYASKSIQGSIDKVFDLVFNKTLSQKSGSMSWGPGPAKGGQNFQNMPSLWRHIQKSPHRKRKTFFFDFDYKTKLKRFFFIANYMPSWVFRVFEQLSSSIWRRVIACGEMAPRVTFEGAKFLSIFGLWAIIFAPDMLDSQSKAL